MSDESSPDQSAELTAAQRRVVIRPRLFRAISEAANERETDITEEVNRAVREMLEREHRWPPKPAQKDDDSPRLNGA